MAVRFKGLGYVVVTTAGTAVPISSTPIISAGCSIRALPSNTGVIYVGGADLNSLTRGAELGAGDAIEIVGPQIGGTEEEIDLSQIYVDASVSGEQVIVNYFIRRG
jgi:hypothetical protein